LFKRNATLNSKQREKFFWDNDTIGWWNVSARRQERSPGCAFGGCAPGKFRVAVAPQMTARSESFNAFVFAMAVGLSACSGQQPLRYVAPPEYEPVPVAPWDAGVEAVEPRPDEGDNGLVEMAE
jgi:hypothetical protein